MITVFRRICFYNTIKFNSTLASRNVAETPPKALKSFQSRPWTDKLEVLRPENFKTLPMYRVLDDNGRILNSSEDPELPSDTYLKMYRCMLFWNILEKTMFNAQRQGRITFFITTYGEEAIAGSAAALSENDWVFSQYRESGVLLYRGMGLKDFLDQLFGNDEDYQSFGRSSPVAYGSRHFKFATISPPLATQIPQAVGTAYVLKRSQQDACVVTFFGDGAASEGDAHAAINFAATLECPVIFFCRNNGYAISTPTIEQYRGDGIAARAEGYGTAVIRVDGNDVLAVYNATRAARQYAVSENKPVILEAMTYRVSHHSTSDDSSAYRDSEELQHWQQDSPINRFRLFLESRGLWDSEQEQQFVAASKKEILDTLVDCEKKPKPKLEHMFIDVYDNIPKHIRKQMHYLENHLDEYKDCYPSLKDFKN